MSLHHVVNGVELEMTPEEEAAFNDEIANAQVDLVSYAAQKRFQAEVGGITVDAKFIQTDDRSKLMFLRARVRATANPSLTKLWKLGPDDFKTYSASELIAIDDAIDAHVQACFDTEADLLGKIEDGIVTKTDDIDAAFAALPTLTVTLS